MGRELQLKVAVTSALCQIFLKGVIKPLILSLYISGSRDGPTELP